MFSKQGNDMTGSHFQNSFSRLCGQLKRIPELFFFPKCKTSLEFFEDLLKMMLSLYLSSFLPRLPWRAEPSANGVTPVLTTHVQATFPSSQPVYPGVVLFFQLAYPQLFKVPLAALLSQGGALHLCWDILSA